MRLRGAASRPGAARFEGGAKPRDILPYRVDAIAGQRRDRPHHDLPFREGRADQMHRIGVFGGRPRGVFEEIAIRLVDQDQIGQFDDAALDPLQFVAGGGRQDQQKHVDHLGDRGFRLAGADRLDQHGIEPSRFAR